MSKRNNSDGFFAFCKFVFKVIVFVAAAAIGFGGIADYAAGATVAGCMQMIASGVWFGLIFRRGK